VYDSSGRGVPGVELEFGASGSGFSWEVISDGVSYGEGPAPTGTTGELEVILTATGPPDDLGDVNNSDYPCGCCSGSTDQGVIADQYGSLNVSAPSYPNLGSIPLQVFGEVTYTSGCSVSIL
jgi:hypothetical protein